MGEPARVRKGHWSRSLDLAEGRLRGVCDKGPPPLRIVYLVPTVLVAVIIGLVTTQVAFVVTTVYLHRRSPIVR